MVEYVKGSDLPLHLQKEALRLFTHRYTREHVPAWSRHGDYPVQFASDTEWLAHSDFPVTKRGELAVGRSCFSRPTWPDNPELRRTA